MNYEHRYHAGNFADVIKHSVLSLILESLCQKESSFCFIDTHAGAGCYDLNSEEAEKTQEAQEGILKLWADPNPPDVLKSYLNILQSVPLNSTEKLSQYPGSPWIADQFCRRDDLMILNELHPEACRLLKRQFNARDKVYMHQRNAYEFLPAVLPPAQKRGLILIDPPFEEKDEELQMAKALELALKKFSNGVYLLWFPITGRDPVWRLSSKLESVMKNFKYLNAYLRLARADSLSSEKLGLMGTGLVIINPPYLLQEKLENIFAYFSNLFAKDHHGKYQIFSN